MVITVENTKAALVVPPSVRRKAGFRTGDLLEFKVSGGVVTILPRQRVRPRKSARSVAGEYTPEQRRIVDARLAKSDDDIKHGRLHGPFDTHEDFIASLHKEAGKLRAKKARRKPR